MHSGKREIIKREFIKLDFGPRLRLCGQLPASLLSDVSCLMSELLTIS